ncbi:hypothetical protein QEJ31_05925 [Pigmentibacter sp. JX0631]|uniref:hypothetical protein n=1 Tax=Pigmentibacter sp. JX0631 TaxID=2976982 RepID=UPI0024696552|nr:hypothetical protein [Pigmentibacter sp. JX0631]WGL61133.1 hypothetical protein QEJ31_05925 [Pigmentibacter sp. JX0631]
MRIKNVILLLLIIIIAIIIIIFLENYQKSTDLKQTNTSKEKIETNSSNNERVDYKKGMEELNRQKRENEIKKTNSIIKTKYNEDEFKKYIKDKVNTKIPNHDNLYFIDNISAVYKKSDELMNREYLWQDEEFLYYKSSNKFDHFSNEEYLALFDKNTNSIYTTNGFFILKHKKDPINFSGMYDRNNVDKVTDFKEDISIVRAKNNSNLVKIYQSLQNEKNLISVSLEILDNILVKDF